ncbi:MAG: hypothetical protein K2P84_05465 [Undibacterium sp.]|nr:hypothetical protein [Undibacterium sp.]
MYLHKNILKNLLLSLLALTQLSCSTPTTVASGGSTHITERVLKKKILMTGFAVAQPMQVQDLDDIAQGLPREILRRLENSGAFLTRQSKNLLSTNLKQEMPTAKLVQQIAADNDAQFVIAGEVRSANTRSDKKYWGLWESKTRQIEIEFAIYDGMSGVFLSRHHLLRPAEDDTKIGRDKTFGSSAFYATNFGKAIDAIIEESSAWIRTDLAHYPMIAKIIQANASQVGIDAGVTSNLRVGDQGLVVADYVQLPFNGMSSQQSQPSQYGTPQASMGKMKLIQVQYPFSVGELAAETQSDYAKVKVGDYVRFDVQK